MRDLKIKLNFSSDTVALVNAQNEIGPMLKRVLKNSITAIVIC